MIVELPEPEAATILLGAGRAKLNLASPVAP